MKIDDPTIATLLRAQGYVTGQFGKNHLGDRDEMLPTNNGFDEFFGNLYHLNAEEEPEIRTIRTTRRSGSVRSARRDPQLRRRHASSTPAPDEEAHGDHRRGGHRQDDRLHRAREQGDKPFFVWWNSTRMHIFTHLKPESDGKTGLGIYADGMVEHDAMVGSQLLDKLKELGLEKHHRHVLDRQRRRDLHLADGGTTMFRGERTPTGKAATACRPSSAGRARSSPAP